MKKFSVVILDKKYEFDYISEEHEQCSRKAADLINEFARKIRTTYIDQDEKDILRIIAFQTAVNMFSMENKGEGSQQKLRMLEESLHSYIEKEENSR